MKRLTCKRCGIYLGEIEKGKVKNGTVFLCSECMGKYEILEGLDRYKGATRSDSLPEGFKEIFDKFV